MMHHHAKFRYKSLNHSENIIQTNVQCSFELLLRSWPWTQQNHIFTWHSGWWLCTIKLSSVGKWSAVQKIYICFDYMIPVPLTLKMAPPFFFSTWLWFISPYQIWLLTGKGSSVQKILSRQILTEIVNICCDLDTEHNSLIFSLDTPAHDDLPSN